MFTERTVLGCDSLYFWYKEQIFRKDLLYRSFGLMSESRSDAHKAEQISVWCHMWKELRKYRVECREGKGKDVLAGASSALKWIKRVFLKFQYGRNIILLVFLYGCWTWSLTLREERRLRVFENRVLRNKFSPKTNKITDTPLLTSS